MEQEEEINGLYQQLLDLCSPVQDPLTRLWHLRLLMERVCLEALGKSKTENLNSRIDKFAKHYRVPAALRSGLHDIRRHGNAAVHQLRSVPVEVAADLLRHMAQGIQCLVREPIPQQQLETALAAMVAAAQQQAQLFAAPAVTAPVLEDAEPTEGALNESLATVTPLSGRNQVHTWPGLSYPLRMSHGGSVRVWVADKNLEEKKLYCLPEDDSLMPAFDEDGRELPPDPIVLCYGIDQVNANQDNTFSLIEKDDILAITDLVTVDGGLAPRYTTWQPDYLLSITSVAECVSNDGEDMETGIIKLLQPRSTTDAILLGNVINAGLDAIIAARAAGDAFHIDQWVKTRLFQQFPLEFTCFFPPGAKLSEFVGKIKLQLRNLCQAVDQGLLSTQTLNYLDKRSNELGDKNRDLRTDEPTVDPRHTLLEPTYFSPRFGLQGRLDVLAHPGYAKGEPNTEEGFQIVELKSSAKVPFAAPWANHVAQAQLYRMLVPFVPAETPWTIAVGNAKILYSAADPQHMVRRCPADMGTYGRLLDLRNRLVWFELQLSYAASARQVSALLRQLFSYQLPGSNKQFDAVAKSFTLREWRAVKDSLNQANPVARDYVFEYLRFVLAEKRLAKIGSGDAQQGVSQMWRSTREQKLEAKALAENLTLAIATKEELQELNCWADHLGSKEAPGQAGFFGYVWLTRPAAKAAPRGELAEQADNFDESDMLVLYPMRHTNASGQAVKHDVLDHPLLRGSVSKIVDNRLLFQLSSKFVSHNYLALFDHWALEKDAMDSNADKQLGTIMGFLQLREDKQKMLLGLTPPTFTTSESFELFEHDEKPSDEHIAQLNRALNARDYYLLVGPPGTGKTRFFLRNIISHLYRKTDQNLLLVSYTNRAVDEICEQLLKIKKKAEETGHPALADFDFIRIGRTMSCDPAYHEHLLEYRTQNVTSRDGVVELFGKCRIFVGTCFGLMGKAELFNLKQFQTAIVDEGSQILDPQILSLVSQVDRFIMVGDDKQLPAIVQQDPAQTRIIAEESKLAELGLTQLRNSFFERLKRRAQAMGWTDAFGTLTGQGRMHRDLLPFVNQRFYDNVLRTCQPWQEQPWQPARPDSVPGNYATLLNELATNRLVYYASTFVAPNTSKEHPGEAIHAARLVIALYFRYQAEKAAGGAVPPQFRDYVGVIAPYRHQVGSIRRQIGHLARQTFNDKTIEAAIEAVVVDTVERFQGGQREVMILSLCINNTRQFDQLMVMTEPDENGVQCDRKLNVALTRAKQQLVVMGNPLMMSREPQVYRPLLQWLRTAGAEYRIPIEGSLN